MTTNRKWGVAALLTVLVLIFFACVAWANVKPLSSPPCPTPGLKLATSTTATSPSPTACPTATPTTKPTATPTATPSPPPAATPTATPAAAEVAPAAPVTGDGSAADSAP